MTKPTRTPDRSLPRHDLGNFTDDGGAYRIQIRYSGASGHRLPPRPWINVLANERFGCLVSETGAGYTWHGNSREHRLTPWANDAVTDPHSEALFVRDEESGAFWSPQPGPAPAPTDYETRHEFGVSRFLLSWEEIEHETVVFVPREDPVRIARLRLRNLGDRERRLAIIFYARLTPGARPGEAVPPMLAETERAGAMIRVRPCDAGGVPTSTAIVSGRGDFRGASCTADRESFLGVEGDLARPAALLREGPLDGRCGEGLDPGAAIRLEVQLPAHGEIEAWFLLGEGDDIEGARALEARYAGIEAVRLAEAEVRRFWRDSLSGLQVETPDPALDVMMNGWLVYQVLVCRIWARSALYQSGGAFGFRDQLQDAAALIYLRPELTREQILLHAAHQFVEGDVLHWWHPPASRGIRTRFADDLIWLPYLTAFYVGVTGDREILDQSIRFLAAPPLDPGVDEAYLEPRESGESADLYEHCCRALDRSLVTGAHGLPLFGAGDWNDGMNRVGREGRGESVWMAFFLIAAIDAFAPLCAAREDRARDLRYREFAESLRAAVNDTGWDGDWYRRGYYDDGTPLGSAASDECRIDALVQAWAVMTGAAPPERALRALEAVEEHLVSEEGRIVRLLAPPFAETRHDPGYIKGYAPGVRENGGQYTHAALWVVRAEAELGWRDRAMRLLTWINPVHRTRTMEEIEIYGLEPYVVAADIYGVSPHLGRGGWSWYTGSAGWMYRVTLETILGFRLEDGHLLRMKPRIPDRWEGFRIDLRRPGDGTRLRIEVANPDRCAESVRAAKLDGVDGEHVRIEDGEACIELPSDGGEHRIEVLLGRAG